MGLDTKVQFVHGVGPKMSERLDKLGIKMVRDLIYYFPRTYLDYTKVTKIGEIAAPAYGEARNDNYTIKAKIINIANRRTSRRRFTVTEAVVADDTGSLKVVWFNQPYLEKMLKSGSEVILNGKISYDNFSGQLQMESPTRTNFPQIVPIYPETVGITSGYIGKLLKAISYQLSAVREYIPEEIIKKNQLLPIQEAIKLLHFPESSQSIEKARERMAFDELFLFSLQKQLIKQEILIHKAPKMKIDEKFLKDFVESLPFKLTDAQKKSAWRIIKDLESDQPMNRLLNGDVGSGKTVVAAFAAAVVIKNGYRVALMAPTEILANQHFQTLTKILEPLGISVGLLTLANKSDHNLPDIIVGTHALIQEKVKLTNLGLVIIDEQHRFGVNQRDKLLEVRNGLRPHFLSMTATPIPRTMSLVVFADLDVSVIDEMPADRKKIITRTVPPQGRDKSYEFIKDEVQKGHQVFVICPLIEETETVKENLFEEDRKTVTKESARLQKEVFPDLRIAMLHGKLKSKEKETIMANFKAKKSDILVSTSVVEVGIDIPGATVMMIENAESFGLAQLHQFRGRVGRNDLQSYCLLFSSSNSETARLRLSYMESISSGFELAEKDLESRGPGQMYGYVQSGFWDFRFADIGDRIMIEKATEAAKVVSQSIDKYPELVEKVGERAKHLE
ncbi:MAG: ATP-dependent DNA helicase RecG [Candidatus Berkelbacteria bacterium]|nr:ATP-dependent DNA helicase RecG [Candidatus Berkelbacteria bacterium]